MTLRHILRLQVAAALASALLAAAGFGLVATSVWPAGTGSVVAALALAAGVLGFPWSADSLRDAFGREPSAEKA